MHDCPWGGRCPARMRTVAIGLALQVYLGLHLTELAPWTTPSLSLDLNLVPMVALESSLVVRKRGWSLVVGRLASGPREVSPCCRPSQCALSQQRSTFVDGHARLLSIAGGFQGAVGSEARPPGCLSDRHFGELL